MSNPDLKYDLYLYVFPESDKLFKIPHLSMADAKKYARYWFDMNEMHEYMLVTEDSTPWNDEPVITDKTPEWISLEYNKLVKDA